MNQQDTTLDESEQIRQAACLLLEQPAVLEEILSLGSQRECRNDGIPAILIIEEFGVPQQKRQAMPGDETLGFYYAVLATALTMLVDMKGGDPVYPSVCPAMSAIAEKVFQLATFEQFRLNRT